MQRKKSSSFSRNFERQTKTLSLVLGICALVMAIAVFTLSFSHERMDRGPIQTLAQRLAVAGVILVLFRLLFFTLPDMVRRRGSRSFKLRAATYGRKGVLSRKPPQRNSGSVLVVVLATLAAISALVLQVQLTARSRHLEQQAALRRQNLEQTAAAAARQALQRLADDEDLLCDYEAEPWAQRVERRTPDGIDSIVLVADANRLFDLNNAGRRADRGMKSGDDVLADLLNVCGSFDTGDRTRALHDWVDGDQQGQFESAAYARRKPPYGCPNRLMVSAGELDDVAGWSREMFERKPAASARASFDGDFGLSVTVVPSMQGRPLPANVNTARREVLLAILGLDQDAVVNAIMTLRRDRPLRTLDTVQQIMGPELFATRSPYLSVRSDTFIVKAEAWTDGVSARVRAVARRDGQGHVNVLQWVI